MFLHMSHFVGRGQMTPWQEFWAEPPTGWDLGLQEGEGPGQMVPVRGSGGPFSLDPAGIGP